MISPIQVGPHIWRSAQPSGDDWKELYNMGIRTSLKLNYEEEATDRSALDRGIKIIYNPMPPKDFLGAFGKPDTKDIATAVAAIADTTNWPLLVHCTHGQDRTGITIGEYRVLHENWKVHEAFEEMIQLGFHWQLPDLWLTWMPFYIEHSGLLGKGVRYVQP